MMHDAAVLTFWLLQQTLQLPVKMSFTISVTGTLFSLKRLLRELICVHLV